MKMTRASNGIVSDWRHQKKCIECGKTFSHDNDKGANKISRCNYCKFKKDDRFIHFRRGDE